MTANLRIDQVLSLGVEEEFVLADATTRVTTPRAAEVVEKARAAGRPGPTRVFRHPGEVRDQTVHGR